MLPPARGQKFVIAISDSNKAEAQEEGTCYMFVVEDDVPGWETRGSGGTIEEPNAPNRASEYQVHCCRGAEISLPCAPVCIRQHLFPSMRRRRCFCSFRSREELFPPRSRVLHLLGDCRRGRVGLRRRRRDYRHRCSRARTLHFEPALQERFLLLEARLLLFVGVR